MDQAKLVAARTEVEKLTAEAREVMGNMHNRAWMANFVGRLVAIAGNLDEILAEAEVAHAAADVADEQTVDGAPPAPTRRKSGRSKDDADI